MPDLRVNSSHSRKQAIKAAQHIQDSSFLLDVKRPDGLWRVSHVSGFMKKELHVIVRQRCNDSAGTRRSGKKAADASDSGSTERDELYACLSAEQ